MHRPDGHPSGPGGPRGATGRLGTRSSIWNLSRVLPYAAGGLVASAAFPVMVKQALLDVGGYDEGMVPTRTTT